MRRAPSNELRLAFTANALVHILIRSLPVNGRLCVLALFNHLHDFARIKPDLYLVAFDECWDALTTQLSEFVGVGRIFVQVLIFHRKVFLRKPRPRLTTCRSPICRVHHQFVRHRRSLPYVRALGSPTNRRRASYLFPSALVICRLGGLRGDADNAADGAGNNGIQRFTQPERGGQLGETKFRSDHPRYQQYVHQPGQATMEPT